MEKDAVVIFKNRGSFLNSMKYENLLKPTVLAEETLKSFRQIIQICACGDANFIIMLI